MKFTDFSDTIIALSTPAGRGAIALVRLSGKDAILHTQTFFRGKNLLEQKTHTVHFGTIRNLENEILDEVVVTIFKTPNSFTKENVVEISCHGSPFIVKRIIQNFLDNSPVRYAKAGEFTQRAFLNGRFDLAQAEAVADLIAVDSAASHKVAISQLRGGFSSQIKELRQQLLDFVSLIELELDFGEEDVEFAEREKLTQLVKTIQTVIEQLLSSFELGNAIKNGVPTVIAGKPNAGKSTLLNALLNEEKAIVSEIAGTTRDFIEDEISIEGIAFRFIDTAGLRQTDDKVESIGVERARKKMTEASLILYVIDLAELFNQNTNKKEFFEEIKEVEELNINTLFVLNKADFWDKINNNSEFSWFNDWIKNSNTIFTQANNTTDKEDIEKLKYKILEVIQADNFNAGDTLVTNTRHYESLRNANLALDDVLNALEMGFTGDLLSLDLRTALEHLGSITGEVSNDEILGNIFGKFCIGK
ncbi:tRNA modification GTPase trmE [Bernardetia litoralis DSM 6794]|uniref:tRNA modification GTPase MnmE n=1 Tax=Bernardetia litoralis (strain ATCC 23117 / DSM 6794 / NBRC 15988 / NCIMB 1366 / Fx l1 / Sio-4) TaxID=880071 RepID=I4AGC7_BERLS|nr:tRNA uridine-5-carboxymethylaminomethyl(34) synthesis GTPase MnmE [Bernardetia litoralis]AFM03012.1 tRNA modification GTPase trmE [Bernardetia litoralis DSM 6794]